MTEWIIAYVVSACITLGGIVLTALAARDWWHVRDDETRYRMLGLAGITFLTIYPLYFILMH